MRSGWFIKKKALRNQLALGLIEEEKSMWKELKELSNKLIWIGPCIYAFFNYFYLIEKKQAFTAMGWTWLIVSIAYFFIALYWIIKNWNG